MVGVWICFEGRAKRIYCEIRNGMDIKKRGVKGDSRISDLSEWPNEVGTEGGRLEVKGIRGS